MFSLYVLAQFDDLLAREGERFEAVVLGGAALLLTHVHARATRDVDVLDPEIPARVEELARALARQLPELDEDWLNAGPCTLATCLEEGWRERLVPAYQGRALVLRALGRQDLLATKLFAMCDRQVDWQDCVALAPTPAELARALPWVAAQDAHPDWPAYVRRRFEALARHLQGP